MTQQGMKCQCHHSLSWMFSPYCEILQIYQEETPYTHHLDYTVCFITYLSVHQNVLFFDAFKVN